MNHVFFTAHNSGSCGKLIGKIMLLSLYINDINSFWTSEALENQRQIKRDTMNRLEREAKNVGVYLEFIDGEQYLGTQIDVVLNQKQFVESVPSVFGFSTLSQLESGLKAQYGVQQIIFAFLINKQGRSFAFQDSTISNPSNRQYLSDTTEFLYVFGDQTNLMHELLHLFGAVDFYYPKCVSDLIKKYYPNSVMYKTGKEVDDITMYLIGWTSTLTPTAKYIIESTAYLTPEMMRKEMLEQRDCAYKEIELPYGGTYYGPLKNGVFEGVGKLVFADGTIYQGNFVNGMIHGTGTFYYTDGRVYTGEVNNGQITGYGQFKYADKTVYIGQFFNGNPHGYGKVVYSNGRVLEGQFYNGQFVK